MTLAGHSVRLTDAPRIALVEDDPVLRERILLPGLRTYGFGCEGFGAASELRAAMEARAFDIAILDVGLPDANGFELAQRLRRDSSMGIVMLTGRNGSADRIRGLNDGADAYLCKPVDIAELARCRSSSSRVHRGQ